MTAHRIRRLCSVLPALALLAAVAFLTTCMLDLGSDSTPPAPGSAIVFADIGSSTVTVTWGSATDEDTPAANLMYKVVLATDSASIDTAEEILSLPREQVVLNWAEDTTSVVVPDLISQTTYWFAVIVRDGGLNSAVYDPSSVAILDIDAPVVTGSVALDMVGETTVAVTWPTATDDSTESSYLEYKLVRASTAEAIDTVEEANAVSDICLDWATDYDQPLNVSSGLAKRTSYAFSVLVRDDSGNLAIVTPASITTLGLGDLDPTFGVEGVVHTSIRGYGDTGRSLVIQPDGKIVVAGTYNTGERVQFVVVRYNPNGVLDNTFGYPIAGSGFARVDMPQGYGPATVHSIAIQPSGSIIVAGSYNNAYSNDDFIIMRFTSTGTFDSTFGGSIGIYDGGGGWCYNDVSDLNTDTDQFVDIALATDGTGNIYALQRDFTTYESFLFFYASDGKSFVSGFNSDSLSPLDIGYTFDATRTIHYYANSLSVDSAGRVLVAGMVSNSSHSEALRCFVARLNWDGTVDSSFGASGVLLTSSVASYPALNDVYSISMDASNPLNEKILLGCTGSFFGSAFILRLNSDGTKDTDFYGANGYAYSHSGYGQCANNVILQSNNRILAVGTRSETTGIDSFWIERFLTNADSDTSFGTNGSSVFHFGRVGERRSASIDSQGRLVIVGYSNEIVVARVFLE